MNTATNRPIIAKNHKVEIEQLGDDLYLAATLINSDRGLMLVVDVDLMGSSIGKAGKFVFAEPDDSDDEWQEYLYACVDDLAPLAKSRARSVCCQVVNEIDAN